MDLTQIESKWERGEPASWRDMRDLIGEVKRLRAELMRADRQWISVDERLPQNGSRVLAWGYAAWWQGGEWRQTTATYGDLYPDCWFTMDDQIDEKAITHWMPLPKPPKE